MKAGLVTERYRVGSWFGELTLVLSTSTLRHQQTIRVRNGTCCCYQIHCSHFNMVSKNIPENLMVQNDTHGNVCCLSSECHHENNGKLLKKKPECYIWRNCMGISIFYYARHHPTDAENRRCCWRGFSSTSICERFKAIFGRTFKPTVGHSHSSTHKCTCHRDQWANGPMDQV